MRGLSFKANNAFDKKIYTILKNTNIEQYSCNISMSEILSKSMNNIDFCKFKKISDLFDFTENNECYVIFLELFIYCSNCEIKEEIRDYNDFLNSKCKIAMFIHDSSYVEIYCKDNHVIEKIRKNALCLGYTDIDYITDENDGRTKFSVF